MESTSISLIYYDTARAKVYNLMYSVFEYSNKTHKLYSALE